jgi:hypothetical protein
LALGQSLLSSDFNFLVCSAHRASGKVSESSGEGWGGGSREWSTWDKLETQPPHGRALLGSRTVTYRIEAQYGTILQFLKRS